MRPPPPPPWIADLPHLKHARAKAFHDLPSHAASRWENGHPVFELDLRRAHVMAVQHHCWLCGYRLVDEIGWLNVPEDDRLYSGEVLLAHVGPTHASCALYSSLACPFLRYPSSRRRSAHHMAPSFGRRGKAVIQGWRHYGIFWIDFGGLAPAVARIGHFELVEQFPLDSHVCLSRRYKQALSSDAATGFTDQPRLYWSDTPEDQRQLDAEWAKTKQAVLAAQRSTVTIDGRSYRGSALGQMLLSLQSPNESPACGAFRHPR